MENYMYISAGDLNFVGDKIKAVYATSAVLEKKCANLQNFDFKIMADSVSTNDIEIKLEIEVEGIEKFKQLIKEAHAKVEEMSKTLLQLESAGFGCFLTYE